MLKLYTKNQFLVNICSINYLIFDACASEFLKSKLLLLMNEIKKC